MPSEKKPSRPAQNDPEIKEDEVVRELVADPRDVPESTLIVGFVGRSEDEDKWRVYITPTLDNYVEIRRKDILKTAPLESSDSPIGGTAVWIRKSAKVKQ